MRLAVAGGKGGVGKTTLAVNLAYGMALRGLSVLLVDADVDNPNDHVSLGLEVRREKEVAVFAPVIDGEACKACGLCAQRCPEHALLAVAGKKPVFFEERCSGCRVCQLVCPNNAISEGRKVLGHIFSAREGNLHLVGAELRPGEARSPLVAKALMDHVAELEDEGPYDLVVVDCPPGVGNTLIQALRGADAVLLVTEPTPFGFSTLRLALRAVRKLGLDAYVVVNRADLPGGKLEAIRGFCSEKGLEVLAEIPYDEAAVEAGVKGVPLVALRPSSPAGRALSGLIDRLAGMFHLARGGAQRKS